jgi:DNA mismatch repair protein MSH5
MMPLELALLRLAALGGTAAGASVHSMRCQYNGPQLTCHCPAGWHPLTASLVESFQPNDTSIDAEKGRVVVITGPNSSGKSVYLEQIGMIVFLAHIGCFVPAQEATVGLVDTIASRMAGDLGHSESFAGDLVQLSRILKAATARSLLLIDEFGKVCKLVHHLLGFGARRLALRRQVHTKRISECLRSGVSKQEHSIQQMWLIG